jgi:hypothetical protein
VPFAELEPDFLDIVSQKTIASLERHLLNKMAGNTKQEIIHSTWNE